ncbi:peptide ABC transporter substrate-binding protein [Prauserella marina]|uniref:Peptide/nickel transport system substrate-binding protein n=1 Tax=Prauserella marina TaxID=530584 RepID=A0A222VIY4_9PSEU|nr:ABC transporter substrate-binding protein [Prauserella marina]ASR33681.1 peptide ABC transporter substrate-binding protein [Prauserella marina]PWV82230.1 peptide/nickel transport system substrate-binding protein [Prauserella marina]SDC63754.1 peptide/nickel transport system substrate-binding protein [Prauserella marina]
MRTRWLAAVLAALLVVSGCSAGSTATVGGGESTLAVGFTAEPQNFDFTTTDGAAIPQALLYNVYEGLVKLDANGEIVPLLAESWQVGDDRTDYEFQLRQGVRFSDGAEFTADDVKFSIERVRTEWTISLASAMDVVERVDVLDPYRVRVVLSRPSNSWLFAMTSRVGAMFSRTGVADLANHPVGTGPYQVTNRRRGDSIVLSSRQDYWGGERAYRTVVLKYYDDATALNNALLSNGIDVISGVTAPDSVPQFEADTRFDVIQGTTNSEVVLAFNNRTPALSDKRVRQALSYAIDKKALLATAWAGRGTLIGSMVPPTDPWYEDLSGAYPYNPARARQLLADAGKQDLDLRLRVPNLPYAVSAAQVVASDLNKVGVTVRIEPLDFPAVWLQQVFTDHDYDLSIIQHVEGRDITTFGDPDYYWGYDSERVRELLADADTGSPQRQVEDMKAVARTLSDDAAADWLFLFPNIIVTKKDVTGFVRNQVSESFDLTGLK